MFWKNKQLMPAAKQNKKSNTKRRWILPMLASAVVLVAGCGKISEWFGGESATTTATAAGGMDWSKPDALIRTRSLADVPKDLLTVPLARDVLTEDFLFFYEQEERFLSIKGALRRVAYEHELQWGDELLYTMLDEPAEVAFWRGESGAIEEFAIAADRGNMASLLMQAGKLKYDDANLRELFTVQVDGDAVPVYALGYGGGRELVFAAQGSRVVVASSAKMVQNAKGEVYAGAEAALQKLLASKGADGASGVLMQGFGANAADSAVSSKQKHSVLVRTHFLSMGYQRFFPALQAVRFDFNGGGGWQTSVLLNGKKLQTADVAQAYAALPQYLPQRAAACVALPVQWSELEGIAKPMAAEVQTAAAAFAQRAVGPLGVCWSGKAQLHNPAFVVQFKPKVEAGAENTNAADATTADLTQALPVLMQAFVGSAKRTDAGGAQGFDALQHAWGRKKQYNAAALFDGKVLIASPDAAWAQQVQAVAQRTQPALSDVVSGDEVFLGYFAPKQLAGLLQQEVNTSLPRNREKTLRAVADARIAPRLQAVAQHAPMALQLPKEAVQSNALRWYTVPWRTVNAVR